MALQYPNLVAMVGFVRRFDPSYAEAKAAIDSGELGRPFLVRSQTCDQNDPDGFFVKFAPSSGGIFMDCSVHDIDLARWMLGNPKATRVFASGTIALHPGLAACGDVDNGLAIVEFDGGQRAVFYASRTMPHGHETATEVIGTTGTLQVGVVRAPEPCAVPRRLRRGPPRPARFLRAFWRCVPAGDAGLRLGLPP